MQRPLRGARRRRRGEEAFDVLRIPTPVPPLLIVDEARRRPRRRAGVGVDGAELVTLHERPRLAVELLDGPGRGSEARRVPARGGGDLAIELFEPPPAPPAFAAELSGDARRRPAPVTVGGRVDIENPDLWPPPPAPPPLDVAILGDGPLRRAPVAIGPRRFPTLGEEHPRFALGVLWADLSPVRWLHVASEWVGVSWTFYAVLWATVGTVFVRLWDETAGAEVSGSVLSSASATPVELESGPLTLSDGHVYRGQKGQAGSDAGFCGAAFLKFKGA